MNLTFYLGQVADTKLMSKMELAKCLFLSSTIEYSDYLIARNRLQNKSLQKNFWQKVL